MRLLHFLPAAVAAALALTHSPAAETSRDLAERHPAGKVVVDFLRLSIHREWTKVAALITPKSLEVLKSDYLKNVTNPNLPFDKVQAMCRAVGVTDEADITGMSPVEFYVAYNKGMQERYKVTDAINRRIADTLELNLLSIAEEGPDLVHLVVRTKHRTMTNYVQNLEIISLVKENGNWRVALGEQQPKYSPLPAAKPPPAATRDPDPANK